MAVNFLNILKMKKAQEKNLERRLCQFVQKCGGECLKFQSPYNTGWPDRFIFMPDNTFFFAEIKTEGEELTLKQKARVKKARKMGFTVFIIDSEAALDNAIFVLNLFKAK